MKVFFILAAIVTVMTLPYLVGLDIGQGNLAAIKDENAALRQQIDDLESQAEKSPSLPVAVPSQSPRHSPSQSPTHSPSETSGPQTDNSYVATYRNEELHLVGFECGGDVIHLDLDEPRVLGEASGFESDVAFETCIGPPRFTEPHSEMASVESLSAAACIAGIRTSPRAEVGPLRAGLIICVETSNGDIAAVKTVEVDGAEATVVATAWEART